MPTLSVAVALFVVLLAWFSASPARADAEFEAAMVAAEIGDAVAQAYVGAAYVTGKGAPQDYVEA